MAFELQKRVGPGPLPVRSRLFGRQAELRWLEAQWQASRRQATVVFVEGPTGVGKSVLVADWLRQDDRGAVWTTEAGTVSPQPAALLRHLAGQPGASPEAASVPELLNRSAGGGLTWVIADYAAWWGLDDWLRKSVWPSLSAGVMVILESCQPMRRQWAGDWVTQSQVRHLTVDPWTADELAAYWDHHGLPAAWLPAVAAVSAGCPAVAARLADAAAADGATLVTAPMGRVHSFLLERALHPGSRRLAWRAGYADRGLDELVAAAMLVPWFNRRLLVELVGAAAVDTHWAAFVALPLLQTRGPGVYGFAQALRRLAIPLVEEARPWASRQWRWKAANWAAGMRAEVEDDTLAIPILQVLASDWWSVRDKPEVPAVVDGDAGGLWVVGAQGRVQDWLKGAFPHGGEGKPVVVEALGTVTNAPDPAAALRPALLARLVAARQGRWRAPTPGSWAAWLEHAGFTRDCGGEWVWQADGEVLTGWLRQQVWGPRRPLALPAAVKVVQEALECLPQPERLEAAALAAYWPGTLQPTPPRLRRWILDAVASLEVGGCPSAAALLTFYYVERLGSHEAVAERLFISRATYFRTHQRALQSLATQLLPVIAEEKTASRRAAGEGAARPTGRTAVRARLS